MCKILPSVGFVWLFYQCFHLHASCGCSSNVSICRLRMVVLSMFPSVGFVWLFYLRFRLQASCGCSINVFICTLRVVVVLSMFPSCRLRMVVLSIFPSVGFDWLFYQCFHLQASYGCSINNICGLRLVILSMIPSAGCVWLSYQQ